MVTNNFPNLTKVLNDFGQLLVEEYKDALILNDKNASDELYNSVRYILDNKTKGTFEVNLELLEYWKYIENGRKAGKWPPISAIKRWIEVKPVLPRPMANGKLPTNDQLAYLIARKIGLEGITPQPILKQSVDSVMDVMMEFIEEALAKDIQAELDIIYKEVGFN